MGFLYYQAHNYYTEMDYYFHGFPQVSLYVTYIQNVWNLYTHT